MNINYKHLSFTFCILSFALVCSIAHATALDPTRVGIGARSIALGRTSAAFDGDISALFVNPANAADLPGLGFDSMYTNLSEDINYSFIGVARPYDLGTFGLAYLGAGSSGFQATTIESGRVVGTGQSFDYTSSVLNFIYGKNIRPDLAVGANLKMFNKGFGWVSNSSGAGYDLDLGLIWRPKKELTVGLAQQNTLPASIARIKWGTGLEEGIPFNTKLGLTYLPRENILLAADLDYSANSPLALHGGVEWQVLKWLAIRAGLDQQATSASAAITNYCAGVGFNYQDMHFDYAYYYDTILAETNSAHYFSLAYLFCEPAPLPKPVPVPEASPTPEAMPQLKLKSFSDVPWGYWAKGPIEELAGLNIITGYPNGTFKPDKTITRAELTTLLVKLKLGDLKLTGISLFQDVNPGYWAAPYIDKAVEYEWVTGYPDNTFQARKNVSRAEGISIMARFDNIQEALVEEQPFSDVRFDFWAAGYISAAEQAGLLDYLKGRLFEPGKPLTRAEVAEMLYHTKFVKARLGKR
ncbi:MAG: S-layer homology domain-containing protein [Candidatus Saganbacteria bacterium]|nr:S-layer homology domain-containing protein [Candidatus Saganbacteria bacterium]